MEYLVEKKADTGLDRKIKISSSTDAFNLEEVQSIKDAMLEHLIFIGMDNRNNVKKINLLSIGTDCSTVIDTKTIIRNAILSGSSKVILVHNHPSNSLEPSELDEHSTNVLAKVLPLFNITLVDHLIVTEENYLSMYQVNKINKDFVKKEYKMLDQTLLIEENERLKIDIEKLKKENIELRKINIEGRNFMNKYESVIIIKPNLNEEERKSEINKYKEMYEKFSDKEVTVEDLGIKKLAYEIQGNKEGSYAVFNFWAKSEDIPEVERNMRTNDNVMRFITVRQEQEMEDSEDMEDEDMEF